MIEALQGFVPSKVCLSCQGCCRFKEADSIWRPKITDDEIIGMKRPDLLSSIYSQKTVESNGRIKTTPCSSDGHHFCSFFELQTNTCTIYDVRPFECQLYPFVLTIHNGRVAVVVHHHCPFIQEKRNSKEFVKYVDYLKSFFKRKEILAFIRNNPSLIGEYPNYQEELEYLFTVF